MSKISYICILCCLSVLHYGCSDTRAKDKAVANPKQIDLTENILTYFQQEQFDKIEQHFSDNMKRQMNKEQLAAIWAQLNTQVGEYTKSEFHGADKVDAIGDRVVYQCYFGSKKLYFQLAFGRDNQVIGLYFKLQPN